MAKEKKIELNKLALIYNVGRRQMRKTCGDVWTASPSLFVTNDNANSTFQRLMNLWRGAILRMQERTCVQPMLVSPNSKHLHQHRHSSMAPLVSSGSYLFSRQKKPDMTKINCFRAQSVKIGCLKISLNVQNDFMPFTVAEYCRNLQQVNMNL